MPEPGSRPIDRTVLRLRDLADGFRQSLFFLPAIFVVSGGALAVGLSLVGSSRVAALPSFLTTNVENGRAVFTTVATGTMAAVSIVFAVMLVALQLSASRFSPRVVREFVGDRRIQVVMGLEIGTVTYALIGLQTIGTSDEDVAGITVMGAVVLGVIALLALLAAVDHLARSLQVGSIARRVTAETIELIRSRPVDRAPESYRFQAPAMVPASGRESGDGAPVLAWSEGWVQQIGSDALADAIPDGVDLTLDVAIGSYVALGTPIAWVRGGDDGVVEAVAARLENAIDIGQERTMQQDVAFGIVRLEDIALLALSPAINDLNTGKEAIVRLGSVLTAMLGRRPEDDVGAVRPARAPDYGDFVGAAFDEIRLAAAAHPSVLETLLRTLGRIRDEAIRRGDESAIPPLDRQGRLIVEGLSSGAIHLPEDRRRVLETAERCLG